MDRQKLRGETVSIAFQDQGREAQAHVGNPMTISVRSMSSRSTKVSRKWSLTQGNLLQTRAVTVVR